MFEFPEGFALVIVPDGCRREFEPSIEGIKLGHEKGLENLHEILEHVHELGIVNAIVWGASESNLRDREELEVEHLFRLFEGELEHQIRKQDARIYIRGRWKKYVSDSAWLERLTELVTQVEQTTAHITDRRLTVLFGYDGCMEIGDATVELLCSRSLIRFEPERVWQEQQRVCWTSHIPEGNLFIIRTGIVGYSHESDLLLPFQRRNAEYWTTPICWPFFTRALLDEALEDFSQRRRRCGK